MSLRINHNPAALISWMNLVKTDSAMGKTMEKLSSGFRINTAADDPAGLAISENMRSQIASINQAIKNSEHAISMVQTAEAALSEIHSMLSTMKELVIQSLNSGANDQTMVDADQAQIDKMLDTIDRIAENTMFGSKNLLNGSLCSISYSGAYGPGSGGAIFQIGGNSGQSVQISIGCMKSQFLGTNGLQTRTAATNDSSGNPLTRSALYTNRTTMLGAIYQGTVENIREIRVNYRPNIDTSAIVNRGAGDSEAGVQIIRNDCLIIISLAIDDVSTTRASLGAFQAFTLETNMSSSRITSGELQRADSVIRDSDMAFLMAQFTKQQIMMQAGVAMLAQANTNPQAVLQLLPR
ncbi:MAG: flagellin [bacterium]